MQGSYNDHTRFKVQTRTRARCRIANGRLPEVGEVLHQPERHLFPRRQFGKSKVVGRAFQESGFTRLAFVSSGAQDTIFFFNAYKNRYHGRTGVTADPIPPKIRSGPDQIC